MVKHSMLDCVQAHDRVILEYPKKTINMHKYIKRFLYKKYAYGMTHECEFVPTYSVTIC